MTYPIGSEAKNMTEFLKFYHGIHGTFSSRIELSAEKFEELEKALKPLGITFRSPER